MRILFSSMRLTGHLRPLFPYATALRRRGHEVRVAAPESAREIVERESLEFVPVAHPGDDRLEPIWARAQDLPREWANALFVGDIFAGLNATAALPALRDEVKSWKPDLVVRESAEFAAMVAAAEAQIPVAHVAVNNDFAEEWIYDHARPRVDLLRISVGLDPDDGVSMRAARVFTSFPQSLCSSEAVVRARNPFRVRTPRLQARAGSDAPHWATDDGRPLVYISLGTLPGAASKGLDIYCAAVQAAARLPARVLLSTGGAEIEPGALGAIPDNLTVEPWVDPSDIYPRAAALLCHGGSGTILEALAAGVPMVLTPLHADQPDNAALVEKAGAGLMLEHPTPSTIADALTRTLDDPDLRARAGEISEEIAALPDVDAAVDEMLSAV